MCRSCLINSDIDDLKSKITRGGKRHYIIFIDDFSKYTCLFTKNQR